MIVAILITFVLTVASPGFASVPCHLARGDTLEVSPTTRSDSSLPLSRDISDLDSDLDNDLDNDATGNDAPELSKANQLDKYMMLNLEMPAPRSVSLSFLVQRTKQLTSVPLSPPKKPPRTSA